MSEWYIAIDGATQGPLPIDQARALAAQRPDGHGWRAGFADWLPVDQIPEFAAGAQPAAPAAPPMPRGPADWAAAARPAGIPADEIDFEVRGHEQQYVEIELDPGESAVAEAGAMMY